MRAGPVSRIVPSEETVLKALTSWGAVNTLGGLARNVFMDAGGTWEPGIQWAGRVNMAALTTALNSLVECGLAREVDRAEHFRLFGSTKGRTAGRNYMLTTAWERLSAANNARAITRERAELLARANEIVLARHADEVRAEIADLVTKAQPA